MKLGLLLGAALAPLAFATSALAQTAPQPSAQLDDVVVVGNRPIAESEAAALRVQRNSDSLVTVVASDSVGRLPDQNVAQAVGRLPGAAVARDQGQARYISLRGAPVNWTTLSIDGISIVSPEGRDTRYDSLPSAIASQIVVSKAVTPDMTGETIAGNVNIITRSAFDYPGLRISGKAGGGYVELGGRQEYEGQLVLSDRFDTDMGEFGVLVSGSYYQRNMITDNYETDWETVSQDVQPGAATRLWARETENKLYRLTRRNYSRSGRLDWSPADNHHLFVESIFTTFTDDEARDNYIFDMDDRQADASTPPRSALTPCTVTPVATVTNTGYADTCIGNTSLVGTVYGIDINQRATLRAFEQSVFTNTLGGEHAFNDGWSFDWRLNYTRAIDDRSVVGEARYDSPSTRNLRPTISYNFTDPDVARIQLFRTISTSGPTTFTAGASVRNIDDFVRPLSSLTSALLIDETEAYTGKFDLRRNFDWMGHDTTITFGGRYDQRTKDSDNRRFTLTSAANSAQLAAAGVSTTFIPVSLDAAFNGRIPLGYDFRYFDQQAMRDQVARAAALTPYVSEPGNNYNVTEVVISAYAMARIAYDWGSILGGVRVENIVNTGRAFVSFTNPANNREVEVENELTLVYPSLHINYDLADDKKLRLSFNTGAARPDYDQLRPNFTVDDVAGRISGGNPEAQPERAYGVDAYFEWYIQPQGYVSFGAFYKRVEDVLFNDSRVFGSDALNTPSSPDRSAYTLSTEVNGGEGYIRGLEFAVQQQLSIFTEQLGLPEWMGGFGLTANVTLNDSEAEDPDGLKVVLPNTSDLVYNAGVYYEQYGLSARLNYQRRSEWLDSVGPADAGGNTFWASDDELDFSARYAINDNIEVYFDASNLLDNPGRRYSREPAYTIEWEQFGSRYTGGVRFVF